MRKKSYVYILIMIIVVAADQFTKYLVASSFSLNDGFQIIPGFFSILYTINDGAAWSIMQGQMIIFYLISIAAIVGLAIFFNHTDENDKLSRISIMLIIGGTIGNLIDRIAFHYVRDFLSFIIFGYDFPIFNVADSCLVIGIGLLLINEIREEYGVTHHDRA